MITWSLSSDGIKIEDYICIVGYIILFFSWSIQIAHLIHFNVFPSPLQIEI